MEFACGRGLECKESNSSWFTFAIRKDALLTFDIVPLDPMDDYDFILFKCSSPDCIKGIQSGEVMPDRMCFTQDHTLQGATGLSTYAAYSILYSGPGPSYVAALPVKAGEQYYLMVDNYHYSSKGFKIYFYGLAPAKTKEQVKKVLLKRRAEAVVLENVWFESNKSVLISESDAALTKLAKVLENSQDIHIEIQGYTDNTGNESENVNLSLARAKAVKAYLLKKNIAPQRLHCKGLGSSNPKADNATAEGQKKNRRVEVKVWDDKD
jgi:outer membrane protein OmpA-like peptidoglycan-associated protein